MKNLLIIILILFFTKAVSQVKFEYGYYITHADKRIEGAISVFQLPNIPDEILIKKEKGITEKVLTNTLKELSFGSTELIRKKFTFDPTLTSDFSKLTNNEGFNLIDKNDFLELLVDGEYKLYRFVHEGNSTFFYEGEKGALITLYYKKYLAPNKNIFENKAFVKQLEQDAGLQKGLRFVNFEHLNYNEQELIAFFKKANGTSLIEKRISKLVFNVYAGYSIHTMDVQFLTDQPSESYAHFNVIPEIEYIFNTAKINPTALYFNVKLHAFKKDYMMMYESGEWIHELEYQSLFFATGLKKYFLNSEKIKLFAKIGVAYNHVLKTKTVTPNRGKNIEIIKLDNHGAGLNFAFGSKVFQNGLVEIGYDYTFNNLYVKNNGSVNFKLGYSF